MPLGNILSFDAFLFSFIINFTMSSLQQAHHFLLLKAYLKKGRAKLKHQQSFIPLL